MKPVLRIIFLFLFAASVTKGRAQDMYEDAEQQYLSTCYYYSGLLGYNIDTIYNPGLYKFLDDWLGVKYCYAGNSKDGIDCSGFATTIYNDVFNKSLEGSAADIYKNVTPVRKNELKEGDLVFFKIRKKRVSHVGVYLSRNRFIHASVKSGVVVSDLDEPYYRKYFFKGGRVKEKG